MFYSSKNKRVRKWSITRHDSFFGNEEETCLHWNSKVFFSRGSITCERATSSSKLKVDKGQVALSNCYPSLRKKITQVDKLSLERRKEGRGMTRSRRVFFSCSQLLYRLLSWSSDNYFGQVWHCLTKKYVISTNISWSLATSFLTAFSKKILVLLDQGRL